MLFFSLYHGSSKALSSESDTKLSSEPILEVYQSVAESQNFGSGAQKSGKAKFGANKQKSDPLQKIRQQFKGWYCLNIKEG